ncbi:uncharacterized protein CBO05P1_276 [Clostridium botulinum B str. Osaka05]|uniref:Uncharacterized protein n=1 Tax=Clostridium botulinum B str. Osaka05 TaxID=1407017 RepID=A0A060N607_CLOBO|nr:hypothetical protein [Clostridium botulinum]BAO04995.1 uncharacterized protein CBO05P1_276 [Clostridium botulinum B str. Osaka05]
MENLINLLNNNIGQGLTISEVNGGEKVFDDIKYEDTEEYIRIIGYEEYGQDDYIINKKDIIDIKNDTCNISVFTKDKEIIIEDWK